jgi:outer membrane protein OmpA-like peptidoglycan-associated protein
MNIRLIHIAVLAASLSACSHMREPNTALEQARRDFNSAQSDTRLNTLAPDEFRQAKDALIAADRAWADGGAMGTVDHLAYMAAQRLVIAQETAANQANQAVSAGAAGERDKARLAMRTNEVDAAQLKLAVADAAATQGQARVNDLEAQLKELHGKQTDRGMVVTLGGVLFESGTSQLLPGSGLNMAKLAAFFKNSPQQRASIEGYTDSVGSDAANLDLSQRRADAVLKALVELGVPADLLSTRAHGKAQPAASNGTEAGRQMNRRVEIVFAKQAELGFMKQ